jgi:hypothetical protein
VVAIFCLSSNKDFPVIWDAKPAKLADYEWKIHKWRWASPCHFPLGGWEEIARLIQPLINTLGVISPLASRNSLLVCVRHIPTNSKTMPSRKNVGDIEARLC